MKRLIAALLLVAVALAFAAPARAHPYKYVWQNVTWSKDSLSTYIQTSATIAGLKYSDPIPIPEMAYWPAAADSIPFFILNGKISAAGAATDTLYLDYQWSVDGANWVPALDWDLDAQVHVGAGLAWSFRYLREAGVATAYNAAGVGDWAAGVPNTYRYSIPLPNARALRLVVHSSILARTLNGKLSARIAFPVLTDQ
jgi:hypothetical protein